MQANPPRPGNFYASSGPSRKTVLRALPTTPAQYIGARSPNMPSPRSQPTPINVASPRTVSPLSSISSSSSTTLLVPPPQQYGSSADPEKGKPSSLKVPRSHFSVGSEKGSAMSSTATLVVNGKIAESADPDFWVITPGTPGSATDDWLHSPDPRRDRKSDRGGQLFSSRGLANGGCLAVLILVAIVFFLYPIIIHPSSRFFNDGFSLVKVNASGQIPLMPGNFGLIDKDTPKSAYTKPSFQGDGAELQLVFSDEFNVDGRTFYPGDDPYWEAEDLHYWQTNNLEWYDPVAVTTKGGNLVITLTKQPTHGLDYQGGLVSTWNKFCFTGGLLEVNTILPGASNILGLWPAVWAMGNLGRMGYGASLEGMWPYTYDSCDVGTLPNQTFPNGTPTENTVDNDPANFGALSYLPGQRVSSCTCQGEDHPGPQRPDGSFVGRGAPEIDIFEATIDAKTRIGKVSQSAQWAPFNLHYAPITNNQTIEIHEPAITEINSFVGGAFQQTTSALVQTNNSCAYEASGKNACYSIYGFQYEPGANGYITWISDNRASWTVNGAAMGPDPVSGASQRLVPEEPMYIIANLGLSLNFGPIDFFDLKFPAHMFIDYVRVYQPKDQINIGCSPQDHPTEDYIQRHIEAYTNANLTTWEQYGQVFPKNRLVDTCS